MRELVFAGFGGQGVLTAGLVLSQIALYADNNATWMPSYGPSMRGGTANCTVHYGEGKIYNPGQDESDLLLAMNDPSLKKFEGIVREGGAILINSDIVTIEPENLKEGVKVYKVPCNTLAAEVGNAKGANIVMVGAIVKILGDFSYDLGVEGMNDMFRKKGKAKFEEANMAAFKAGYDAV